MAETMAGLARVGRPDNRDHQPVANPLAAFVVIQMRGDGFFQITHFPPDLVGHGRGQVFVGKIDHGLQVRQSLHEAVAPIVIELL